MPGLNPETLQKIEDIFNSTPSGDISKAALKKWNELGPIQVKKLIAEHKIVLNELNCRNRVKKIVKYKDLNNTVHGQVNSNGTVDGLARWYIEGDIIEGQFENGHRNGYVRVILKSGGLMDGYF